MSCSTLQAITKGCDNNSGGIREIYLWGQDDVLSGPTIDANTWEVTALSISGVAGGTGPSAPVAYEFIRNSSNYTEEAAIDLANGSTFYNATINLMFTRREASKSKAIKILGEGQRYLQALVKDNNGNYWYFTDLQVSAVGEGSGTARADGSKYSVTLLGETEYLAYGVDATDAQTLISTGIFS